MFSFEEMTVVQEEPIYKNKVKKSILVLDSPYSNLFRDIIKSSSLFKEYSIYTLFSSPAYRIYNYGFNHLNLKDPQIYNKKNGLNNKYLDSLNIDLVFFFNDSRPIHFLIKKYLSKRPQIKTIFFENGAFRPNTISIDNEGVNSRASFTKYPPHQIKEIIQNNIGLYKDISISPCPNSFFSKIYIKIKFFIFIIIFRLCKIIDLNYRSHNNFNFNEYWHRLLSQIKIQKTRLDLKGFVVFVPLQLNRDSQLQFYSPIKNNKDFIKLLESIASIYPEFSFLIKSHPNDTQSYFSSQKNIYFCNENKTEQLVDLSNIVLTLNSTVGFEALQKNKKVIVLGESFYTNCPYIYKTNPINLEAKLGQVMQAPLPKQEDINKYIHYVFSEYQVDSGNIHLYSQDTIIKCTKRINKLLDLKTKI